MNPICTNCNSEMVTVKTGITVASVENPHWTRSGDKVRCENCGSSVIVNMGQPWHNPVEADILVG